MVKHDTPSKCRGIVAPQAEDQRHQVERVDRGLMIVAGGGRIEIEQPAPRMSDLKRRDRHHSEGQEGQRRSQPCRPFAFEQRPQPEHRHQGQRLRFGQHRQRRQAPTQLVLLIQQGDQRQQHQQRRNRIALAPDLGVVEQRGIEREQRHRAIGQRGRRGAPDDRENQAAEQQIADDRRAFHHHPQHVAGQPQGMTGSPGAHSR